MRYPCSPSLQTLPVPGIGFCQSIFVDQDAVDRAHRLWSIAPGLGSVSAERTSQEAADLAAAGYRLQ
jgi:hypothetical protein